MKKRNQRANRSDPQHDPEHEHQPNADHAGPADPNEVSPHITEVERRQAAARKPLLCRARTAPASLTLPRPANGARRDRCGPAEDRTASRYLRRARSSSGEFCSLRGTAAACSLLPSPSRQRAAAALSPARSWGTATLPLRQIPPPLESTRSLAIPISVYGDLSLTHGPRCR